MTRLHKSRTIFARSFCEYGWNHLANRTTPCRFTMMKYRIYMFFSPSEGADPSPKREISSHTHHQESPKKRTTQIHTHTHETTSASPHAHIPTPSFPNYRHTYRGISYHRERRRDKTSRNNLTSRPPRKNKVLLQHYPHDLMHLCRIHRLPLALHTLPSPLFQPTPHPLNLRGQLSSILTPPVLALNFLFAAAPRPSSCRPVPHLLGLPL